jgi:hypothetical protein
MIVCGKNILTSNDFIDCGNTNSTGLAFTQVNFASHYPPGEGEDRLQRDSQIREYHFTHSNPVLALQDDGYVEIDSQGTRVIHRHCWLFMAGEERILLEHEYIG